MFSRNWRTEFETKEFNRTVNESLTKSLMHTHMVFHKELNNEGSFLPSPASPPSFISRKNGGYIQEFTENAPGVEQLIVNEDGIHWNQIIPKFNTKIYCNASYSNLRTMEDKLYLYITESRWYGLLYGIQMPNLTFISNLKHIIDMVFGIISPLDFPYETYDNRAKKYYRNDHELHYCPISKVLFVHYYRESDPLRITSFTLYRKFKHIDRILDNLFIPNLKSEELAWKQAVEDEQIIHYELTEEEIVKYS